MSKSIKINSLFSIIYNVSNVLFPLVTSVYVSRILMADGIGRVAYAKNIASYFIVLATLGLPTYGVREIAKLQGDQEHTNKLFTELMLINTASTTVSWLLFFSIVWIIPKFHSEYCLFFACGIQIILNYLNIDWLYQGREEYAYITLRSILIKVLSLTLVLIFVKQRDDYVCYALITSIAVTANYCFGVFHARKIIRFNFISLNFKRHIVPLIVLAVAEFLFAAYSKIDITMLGTMSTKTATGLYNNAHKIIDVVIATCTAISVVFLPRLSYYYEKDRNRFIELIIKGVKVLCFTIFPVFVGIILVAPQMTRVLYGKAFESAADTIRIFSVLIIIKGFGNLLCYQLILATGNEKKRLPAFVCAAMLNIVLNYLLIPNLAEKGAAIASIISEVVVNGYQLYVIHRIITIPYPKKAIRDGLVSSLIMGVCVFFVMKTVSNYYYQLIFAVIVGTIVYVLTNAFLKNESLMVIINDIKRIIK